MLIYPKIVLNYINVFRGGIIFMENKNGMVLDDNSLENASGGLWLCNKFKQKHYPVDSNGNIDWNSGHCNKSKVEAHNDVRNINNR